MKKLLIVSCLLLIVGLLAGCGERTETTYYYYSPSWVRDGKVILTGATQSVRKDYLGSQLGSTYTEYVMTIYPSGTGESASLFDVTGEPPYGLTYSPTTDYIAYMADLRSGLYSKIVIRNISSGTHTGLEKVELLFSPGIKSFDWSNDGTKLAYCTTQEVRIIDIDGNNDTLVTAEANLESIAWKYGGLIAFVRSSGSNKILTMIYSDGTGRVDLTALASVDLPQISSTNINEVFGKAGSSLSKVDVRAGTPATTEVKASFAGVLPRLSPDVTRVTYSKSGETSGVYVLVIATGVETKIK